MATPQRAEISPLIDKDSQVQQGGLESKEKLPLNLFLTEKLQGPSVQIMAKLDKGERNTILYGIAIESMKNFLNDAIEQAKSLEFSKQKNIISILENYKEYLNNFNPQTQQNAGEFQAKYRETFESLKNALEAPLV